MSKTLARTLRSLMALALVAAACSSGRRRRLEQRHHRRPTAEKIDYTAIGLWDDGPCDAAKPPLKIGLMTVFESPVLSLKDQATALEASATAFNERGGANGSCIEVTTCDDGGNVDQAVACVRDDRRGRRRRDGERPGHRRPGRRVRGDGRRRRSRGSRRTSTQDDWADPNAYPLDASGTGVTFLLPQALIDEDIHEDRPHPRRPRRGLGADRAPRADLRGRGATFPYDVPVPGGTTDYSQFILGAQNAGADGVALALGEQEAIQVVQGGPAARAPTCKHRRRASARSRTRHVADLGDFAKQMVFLWSFPPATVDLPVYEALRADLAASGDEALQPENLKASPMRSWIGLYALLKMIRDAQDDRRSPARASPRCCKQAKDVPMLDIFGGENWTPNLEPPRPLQAGRHQPLGDLRLGPRREDAGGLDGNFVEKSNDQLRQGALRHHLRCPGRADGERSGGGRRPRSMPGLTTRRPVTVQSFLQFLIIGLGAGATYALFAQGAVLIYRGSGLVNFAQGAIGTFAAYIAFVDLKDEQGWATLPAVVVAVLAAGAVSLAFQAIVLRALRRAAPIVRVIATIGAPRPAPGRRREALRRRQPTGRLLPPPRRVQVGRHHRPGGADLPRRASPWS